jgi:PleD family two-component response regulator
METTELYRPAGDTSRTGGLPQRIQLKEDQRFIVVEAFNMPGRDLLLTATPSSPRQTMPQVRAQVRESLQRSLRDHADVWTNLADK